MVENYANRSNRGSNSSSAANSTNSNLYSTGSSARLSSGSTLPSSHGGDTADDLYLHRSSTLGVPSVPRALTHRDRASTLAPDGMASFYGQKQTSHSSAPTVISPPPPPVPEHTSRWSRSRATTSSSYASTARPPKLDLGLSSLGDFGEMFEGNGDHGHGARSQVRVCASLLISHFSNLCTQRTEQYNICIPWAGSYSRCGGANSHPFRAKTISKTINLPDHHRTSICHTPHLHLTVQESPMLKHLYYRPL